MKRAMITGGAGFVSANLARRLLREGLEVTLIVRPGSDRWRLAEIANRVAIHEVPLENPDAVRRAVTDVRPEWVFHLAAHGAYSWQSDAHRMVQLHVLGTIHLVEACLETGFEALIHTGSSSEYGFKDHAPSESEPIEPNSVYAVTKAAATLYASRIGGLRGAPIVTLRLYSVFGAWEDPRRLIPTLIRCGLAGRWPALADPATARDFVHVDDVVEALWIAAVQAGRHPGEVFNVGTGVQTTLADVARVAAPLLGLTGEPAWRSLASRAWDTDVWVADARKAGAVLGWAPLSNFESGLRRTVEWFRSHPELSERYARSAA